MRLDVLVLHRRLVEADARELRGELRDVGGELLDRRVGLLVERRLEVGELLADARAVDLLRDLDAAVDELGDLQWEDGSQKNCAELRQSCARGVPRRSAPPRSRAT
jgi:hypothetical protein